MQEPIVPLVAIQPLSAPAETTPSMRGIYASVWSRIGAWGIDWILVYGVGGLILSFVVPLSVYWLLAVWWVQFVYQVIFHAHLGATPGMLLTKQQLTSTSRRPITYAQAVVRYLCSYISFVLGGIGYLLACIDTSVQTLHDKIAHTYVIQS